MDFNLERAMADWRKAIVTQQAPEAEDLAELESGLLDRYDEYLIKGYTPAEAFAAAQAHTLPVGSQGAAAKTSTVHSRWSLLRNYLKLAGRNIRARRWYNLTNYVSLSLGIATAALALLYLTYETSYDKQLPDVARKYRVGMNLRSQGYSLVSFADFNGTEAAGQQQQIQGFAAVPGVVQAVQFANFPEPVLGTYRNVELPLEHTLQTNTPAAFLDFFGVELLVGDPGALGSGPNRVVLTQTTAARYFGPDWRSSQLTGELLRIDTVDYTIAGVAADPPANSHFTYSLILHQPQLDYWGARTYLKLDRAVDPADVQRRIEADFGSINARLATDELFGGVLLQPVRSIHLSSDLLYELKPPGSINYLYIIGIIAVIILLLAISNYTNLSIVMNAGRAREIGMRKVFGATRAQITGQFLLEAILLSLLTLPVVLLGLWWIVPRFNLLMDVALTRNLLADPRLLTLLSALSIGIGLLAGGYPALLLAGTRVQGLFRGRVINDSGGRITTRRVIITLQFVLLIGLCSLTLFVNRQLRYIQEKDLGYRREGIVYVNINADSSRFATFRNELLRVPGVTAVGSGTPMGQTPFNQTTYKLAGTEQVFDDAHNIYLDYRAIDQLGIQTSIPNYVADPDRAPDRLVLINELLATRLQNRFQLTAAELIGQTLLQEPEYIDEETGQVGFPYTVAGTFADLHMFSLRETIDPMFLTVYREPRFVYTASISYTGDRPRAELLADLRRSYEEVGLSGPFAATFLTDNLTELYGDEKRVSTLSTYFSLLAFLMAIVGLVALTAYLTTLKRKEIGIRMILGATPAEMLRRFNLEYVPLLLLAMGVTLPVAWWGIDRWLAGFAYRIPIEWWVFVLAVGVVALITGIAVSLVTLRATRSVPARVLTRND